VKQGFEVRFWAKVKRAGPDDCWPWLGARDKEQYGRAEVGRDTWQVIWWWRFPWPWCWAFGEWPAHHPPAWRIFRYWYFGLFEVRRLRGTFPKGPMPSE
jgi:hypothetical protein